MEYEDDKYGLGLQELIAVQIDAAIKYQHLRIPR